MTSFHGQAISTRRYSIRVAVSSWAKKFRQDLHPVLLYLANCTATLQAFRWAEFCQIVPSNLAAFQNIRSP